MCAPIPPVRGHDLQRLQWSDHEPDLISGVLAFPAKISAKAIGVIGGLLAIQAINMVRIISLFYIGIYLPKLFNSSHIFIWQSLVIVAGVTLWIVWAHWFAFPPKKNAD